MRIRASILTPVLAILTVAALIGTGIMLGQGHGVQADAMLLGSTPEFPAPVSAEAAVVADAGPAGKGVVTTERPAEQTHPVVVPAPAEPGTVTEGQVATEGQGSSSRPAPTTRPTTPMIHDSTGSSAESDESDQESAEYTAVAQQYADHESADHESEDVESHTFESQHD
jgi:hypothetical protein